ncbi:hypothetical protein [Edwardsiella anguillarum]|nr:hypothetical protein [Edwardsiella anguillarum]KAB0593168.1 hypothetical protein F7P84_00120 [Edwardsiella anguillarum]WHP82444.1 hypothetical protein MQ095_11565 [Edwardsiella anguillarum]WHP86243.1 hypothetical protein MQ088_11570 [Edwardsiella anguillarum]WHP90041.1 hypothetical protein MQ091_11565 [Edwardsiella anguillarum]WHP93839.1 hypothetical protein MQ096_11570 [Edwardsiella anguillarum]
MKPIQICTVAGKTYEPASMELVLVLNGIGRGFITITPENAAISLAGAMVQIDLGEGTEAWRYFTGYIERDQPAENGARQLFVREAAGLLDFDFPCSHQHPTLKTVLDTLSQQSGLTLYAPENENYSTTRIPHLTHAGSGTQLLAMLGRCFAIPDYVWHPMPDGSVYVGSAKQSRFASLALPELPPQYLISQSAGNSATLMQIPTLRPGVNLPNGRITDITVKDSTMTLTWARRDASGKPLSKSPIRRLIEGEFPELATGALRTRLARVASPTESASLGDAADPFRPKYAVDLQLLDEQGNDLPDTPVYAAVPLPVPMAGPEAGQLAYPPEGTLVEVAFVEGRPDKPMVRQVIPHGHSLPDIKPGEQLQQQRAEVFQRVGQDGSWHRETDQVIREASAQRNITSDSENRTTTTRETLVQANDTTTVLGTARLLAGHTIQIADGDYSIAAGNQLLMKAKVLLAELERAELTINGSLTETVTGNVDRTTGGNHTETTTGQHSIVAAKVAITAGSLFLGRGGTSQRADRLNLLTLLLDILDLVNQLAQHTAEHSHSNTGTPTNNGSLSGDATQATNLKAKYRNLIA